MSIDNNQFGPWAVVTGASSGIGREFARQLAAAGVNLVLVARRLAILQEVGADLGANYGVEHRAVGVDLSEPGSLTSITEATEDLDVGLLVSNAGAGKPGSFLDTDLDLQRRLVRLNTTAHLELTHHFGQLLARRGRGGIVLVSALGAVHGIPYMANAAATKAYVASLGDGLHVELAKHGVHVTVLHPGLTRTPVLAEFGLEGIRLPIPTMSVERSVAETLHALDRNRARCIPGRLNRLMNTVAPPALTRSVMAGMLSAAAQNAEHAKYTPTT